MSVEDLKRIYKTREAEITAEERHVKILQSQQIVSDTILAATSSLIKYLEGHTTKTEIINQLESVNTPDSLAVIPYIESLNETMKGLENTDLSEVTAVMKSILDEVKDIPKEKVEIPENEQIDYSKQFESLAKCIKNVEDAVKAQELVTEAPIVNVPETVVNVEKPDLKPLEKHYKGIIEAIENIVIPEYKNDTTAIEKLIKKSNLLLEDLLSKPTGGESGGRVSPYQNNQGIPAFVELVGGSVPTESPWHIFAIDKDDTTNYYFGSHNIAGSYKIERMNKVTGISDFTTGQVEMTQEALVALWSTRTELTYGILT